jgi:hypothetical protein
VISVLEWFGRLRVVGLVGIIGVLLLIAGNTPARIVGGVMVALVLGAIIVRARRRFVSPSP